MSNLHLGMSGVYKVVTKAQFCEFPKEILVDVYGKFFVEVLNPNIYFFVHLDYIYKLFYFVLCFGFLHGTHFERLHSLLLMFIFIIEEPFWLMKIKVLVNENKNLL